MNDVERLIVIRETLHPTRSGYCAEPLDIEDSCWLLGKLHAAEQEKAEAVVQRDELDALVKQLEGVPSTDTEERRDCEDCDATFICENWSEITRCATCHFLHLKCIAEAERDEAVALLREIALVGCGTAAWPNAKVWLAAYDARHGEKP
jgi:hypothetical protein